MLSAPVHVHTELFLSSVSISHKDEKLPADSFLNDVYIFLQMKVQYIMEYPKYRKPDF